MTKRITKRLALKLGSALLATTALVGLTPVSAQTPRDTIVMAKQIDDIISLDPAEAFEFSGVEVGANVYDKLMGVDLKNNNALIGDLAASWTTSADNLTYTFKLKPGVKFHSGNALSAADVVYSFQRAVVLNKSPGFILTQFGFNKDNVLEKIKATDDTTVVITVSKPFAPSFFLNCLTSGVASIVDSKVVKANEKVKKNQPLFMVEAMKMETNIAASADGVVKQIVLTSGTLVNTDDLVLELIQEEG